jgi:hypothetical protein
MKLLILNPRIGALILQNSAPNGECGFKLQFNPLQHAVPIPTRLLAKQPHRRIPGAVVPIKQPAPIGDPGKQYPDGDPKRARQMSDARIDAQDKIHESAQRRRIAKVGKRISGMQDARTVQQSALRVGHLFLQASEFEARIEQPPEQLKLYAPALVWYWLPAPDYANSRFVFSAEPMPSMGSKWCLLTGRILTRMPVGPLPPPSQATRFSIELGRTSYHLRGARRCAIHGKTGRR